MSSTTVELVLEPMDNPRLANLCGPLDEHLRQLERGLGVEIHNRGNHFQIKGPHEATVAARELLDALYRETASEALTRERVHLGLLEYGYSEHSEAAPAAADAIQIRTKRGVIRGRSPHQQQYLRSILAHDINFGIGPAGTGKTYLAVACAVHALETDRVRRLILVRPAVEAGEKLGFLPGDLAQKVDPYLRPLYDALYEMLGFESVARLVERNVIEVAPLAYMRGRTLNESFIILDEAQNTTTEQMKMFLTRIGFGSIAVVTGDVTQVDLPRQSRSGLRHAAEVLRDVPGISFTWFANEDVVRHPLVQRIVRAYESHEGQDTR
ncbi:MAG TPA: PhoH family protein [Nevskiales bacterium]|nr:PhoH family protein [Nevskiales bacterium]